MMGKNAYNTILRELILQLFQHQDQWHGYEMAKKLKDNSNGRIEIKENRLYPALHKLEEEGVLTSQMVEVGNRSRKYYKLTEEGSEEVSAAFSKLSDMANTLQLILNTQPHA